MNGRHKVTGSPEIQLFDKAAGGLTHKYLINADTYIRSSLAATYSKDRTRADQITEDDKLVHVGDIRNSKWDIVFNSYLNKKFNSNHINRTGITVTGLQYDLDYKISPNFGLDVPMEQISKGNGEVVCSRHTAVLSST